VLDAVKQGRVLFVEEQIFSRPGPRSVEAVETLAAFLHP
jgi:iron complex transport system substrate-binding protein